VVLLAVALPVGWYVGSPLFIDQRVDEEFPVAAMPTGTAVPAAAQVAVVPTATPTVAPTTAASAAAVSSVPPAVPTATATAPLPPAPTATAMPLPTATPTGPVVLGRGEFTVVDAIHKGVGTATIYQLVDGRRILRLEGFSVTNGPDLFVYLSGHPEPRSSGQLHETADFELARLKGNVGDQNYELPPDLDLEQFRSVVIYCKRFTTVFSTATLGR
jgi:hypothetical protein